MSYILIWEINDYPELCGGIDYTILKTKTDVVEKVNEIMKNKNASIVFCCKFEYEVKYSELILCEVVK